MKTINLFSRTTAVSLLGLLLLGCATGIDAQDNKSAPASAPPSQSVDPGSGTGDSGNAPAIDKWLELSRKAIPFEVFRHWKDKPQHDKALIAVVQTDKAGTQFGLVFMQRAARGGGGLGIVCPRSRRLVNPDTGKPDDAYRCHQHIDALIETLTVGHIESKFCADLRGIAEKKKLEQFTAANTNPIATPKECSDRPNTDPCICFEIKHEIDKAFLSKAPDPPTDGTGSGGRRGGG